MPHETPEGPWNKVGIDLFELQGLFYLVTVGYYFSNFRKLEELADTSTTTINQMSK